MGKLYRDREGHKEQRQVNADDEMVRSAIGTGLVSAAAVFGMWARRRMHERGTDPAVFARVTVKNHRHASLNPNACFQNVLTLEEAMAARIIADPIRLYDCTPHCDGGAAAVVASAEVAAQLARHPNVLVRGSVAISDVDLRPFVDHVGMTEVASRRIYDDTGIGPDDLDVVQVHDAFSPEELDYYEALGICPVGDAEKLVVEGQTEIGGRIPFSTDGGLLSRGHPLGPTGLAQVWETTLQLRGQAGARQVEGARTGMCHMVGHGNVCVIHLLHRT
jgi:acetyl-CoA acetyltransferase